MPSGPTALALLSGSNPDVRTAPASNYGQTAHALTSKHELPPLL
jgi:hypothetical protein